MQNDDRSPSIYQPTIRSFAGAYIPLVLLALVALITGELLDTVTVKHWLSGITVSITGAYLVLVAPDMIASRYAVSRMWQSIIYMIIYIFLYHLVATVTIDGVGIRFLVLIGVPLSLLGGGVIGFAIYKESESKAQR